MKLLAFLLATTGAYHARSVEPTCCSDQRKCCSQTFAPPIKHECPAEACCDAFCETVTLETVLVPPAVTRVKNSYGVNLSADCCDTFFPDGSLCRADLGGNCSGTQRCAEFRSDCGACVTYCASFTA
mmetsp:Transcript_2679/g.7866  ORF Transcript_2679/g.7866 Transcript_2679/m.7866 type:complete len:127 (-) Transcript_2679:111-491(-)